MKEYYVLKKEGKDLKNKNIQEKINMRIKRDIMEEIEEIERIKERRRRWVIVREMKEYIDEEGREIRDIEKER